MSTDVEIEKSYRRKNPLPSKFLLSSLSTGINKIVLMIFFSIYDLTLAIDFDVVFDRPRQMKFWGFLVRISRQILKRKQQTPSTSWNLLVFFWLTLNKDLSNQEKTKGLQEILELTWMLFPEYFYSVSSLIWHYRNRPFGLTFIYSSNWPITVGLVTKVNF